MGNIQEILGRVNGFWVPSRSCLNLNKYFTMNFRKVARQVLSNRQSVLWNMVNTSFRCLHTDPGLTLQYQDDVAVIRMNNKDNRINTPFLKEFNALLDSVEDNKSCKGVITTGEAKFYGNGLDVEWMKTLSAKELVEFMNAFHDYTRRLLLFPLPTLAAINGHAFAGGAVQAFTHDLRVMNSDKGWICFNEVWLNKRFSSFLCDFLSIKLGSGKNASDALMLGQRFTAQEAFSNHMIHSTSPNSKLMDHSMEVLRSFLGKDGIPRDSLQALKKDLYKIPLQSFEKEGRTVESRPYFALQFATDAQLAEVDKS